MKNTLGPQDDQSLDLRLVITGIEGELIDAEKLHYEKWKNIAVYKNASPACRIVGDEKEFKTIWQKDLIGIGDKAVYEYLKNVAREKAGIYGELIRVPSWEECQQHNDAYYEGNIEKAKIPEGMADTIGLLRKNGVRIMIVTHAPQELVDIQLNYIKEKTGLTFDPKDIVLGERKDDYAYVAAFKRFNEELRQDRQPCVKTSNVLVLDNSEKYLKRAADLGMRFASIANDLPAYLKSKVASSEGDIEWLDIVRFMVKGPAPQADRPGPRL